MTGSGRNRTSAKRGVDARQSLAHVRYEPPAPHALNLEVIAVSELRRRVSAAHLRQPQRIEFQLLIAVTRGRCTHALDFVAHDCRPGSWIVVSPGQVQRFDPSPRWDGWLVMSKPEFLLPQPPAAHGPDPLPGRVQLDAAEQRACLAGIEQMRADSRMAGASALRDTLLRHQLHALLLRLQLAHHRHAPPPQAKARSLQRFERFRAAVDADFADTHRVREYASRLGCSDKSLTRSALEATGVSAKAYIAQRIVLEAKRLLVHTSQSVAAIGGLLVFSAISDGTQS